MYMYVGGSGGIYESDANDADTASGSNGSECADDCSSGSSSDYRGILTYIKKKWG